MSASARLLTSFHRPVSKRRWGRRVGDKSWLAHAPTHYRTPAVTREPLRVNPRQLNRDATRSSASIYKTLNPIIHLVLLRVRHHVVEAINHDLFQPVIHQLLVPEITLRDPGTHSKYDTVTPPAFARISGITKISFFARIGSARCVVGPFAPSHKILHRS